MNGRSGRQYWRPEFFSQATIEHTASADAFYRGGRRGRRIARQSLLRLSVSSAFLRVNQSFRGYVVVDRNVDQCHSVQSAASLFCRWRTARGPRVEMTATWARFIDIVPMY